MKKIVIVDDDMPIAELISDSLEDEGFTTQICADGEEALDYIASHSDDIALITLDIMLPGRSGYEVCRDIRDLVDCPIIFLSAKGSSGDIVDGLGCGADGYITKPFVVKELVARVKAHIRRDERNLSSDSEALKIGEIEIYPGRYEAFVCGKSVSLSTKEFHLLQYMMENAGRELTKRQIYVHVWKTEFGDMGIVAVNIKNLRNKLGKAGEYIKTVWGVGYQFAQPH